MIVDAGCVCRAMAVGARVLAWLASSAVWTGATAAVTAPLPAVNLGIEWRLVPDAPGALQTLSRGGDVVVGTHGVASTEPPPGSVTVGTALVAGPAPALQRLRVLNGGLALLQLSRPSLQRSPAFVWTAQGNGLTESLRWVDDVTAFEVRPRWPGGTAPVQLSVTLQTLAPPSAAAGHDPGGPPRLVLQTTVQVPLGQWFVLGQVGRPPAALASPGLGHSVETPHHDSGGGRFELRVLAP